MVCFEALTIPDLGEEGQSLEELSVWLSKDVQHVAEDLSHRQLLWTPVSSTCGWILEAQQGPLCLKINRLLQGNSGKEYGTRMDTISI